MTPRNQETVARLVAAGELVSNQPFRERVEFLQAHDPDFALNTLCARLADDGFPSFMKRTPGRSPGSVRWCGDTSHLSRLLGMRDQAASSHAGKRYVTPNRTRFLEYELACAICRALDMWPTDCGV